MRRVPWERVGRHRGSPLAGDSFLSEWSARPLSAFVDKIQKTMPFSAPGSLSRQQSADLTAYILQVGKFPAGRAELTEATLAQIAFPRRPVRHRVFEDVLPRRKATWQS